MLSRIPLLIEEISLISDRVQASQIHASNQIVRQLGTHSESASTSAHHLDGLFRLEKSSTSPSGHRDGIAQSGSLVSTTSSTAAGSTVRFKAYNEQLGPHCTSNCRCDCHRNSSFRSPSFLDQFLGLLFVGYSGKPFSKLHKCSHQSCQAQTCFRGQVNYIFPIWFVRKVAINLMLVSGYGTEPSITLTVRGVFTSPSDLSQCITRDDSDGLQRLIASGRVRPNDQYFWDGSSVLSVSRYHLAVRFWNRCVKPAEPSPLEALDLPCMLHN